MSAQSVQDRVVVEPEALSDRGAREPLTVELDGDGDLCVGHSA